MKPAASDPRAELAAVRAQNLVRDAAPELLVSLATLVALADRGLVPGMGVITAARAALDKAIRGTT